MAPYPRGMSGGAMYYFTKNQKLKKSLDDSFRFAGIGLEYNIDNTIVGISRSEILEILEKYNAENPLHIYSDSEFNWCRL